MANAQEDRIVQVLGGLLCAVCAIAKEVTGKTMYVWLEGEDGEARWVAPALDGVKLVADVPSEISARSAGPGEPSPMLDQLHDEACATL